MTLLDQFRLKKLRFGLDQLEANYNFKWHFPVKLPQYFDLFHGIHMLLSKSTYRHIISKNFYW